MCASQLKVAVLLATLALIACGEAQDPLAPRPQAAVLTPALPFSGTVRASETHEHPEEFAYVGHVSGGGTASHLGRFTLSDEQVGSLLTLTADVTLVLTAANGDQLYASGTAQATPSGDFSALRNIETLEITGGTGRFEGASGSFVMDRMIDIAGGSPYASTGSITGSIILAR